MQKLEAKIPYFGLLRDKDKFYEVARINYEDKRIGVYTDEKKTYIAETELDMNLCEIRFKKDSLFDE